MNVSRMTSVSQPRSLPGYPGLATLSIAALLAIGFFVDVALPYLRLDPEMLARYWPRRWWLLVHIAAGAVALLTGPVQLWLGISGRRTRVHRRLGLTYVASVAVSSVAAFYLAAQTTLGWVFGAGITGLGIAWLVTTTMAIAAIRRGSIDQHREWMIRSYVVTFAFVTFRVVWSVLQAAGLGTLHEQLAASSWFCWAAPLLVTEAVLQGRKIFAPRHASALAVAVLVLGVPALGSAQARVGSARSPYPRALTRSASIDKASGPCDGTGSCCCLVSLPGSLSRCRWPPSTKASPSSPGRPSSTPATPRSPP